jgi:hypothetical protein
VSDDDETDIEEWMAMSESQREAVEKNAWRDYHNMINAMSREQYYRFRRKRRVDLCLRWRRLIREHQMEFMQERLRGCQRSLVALRHEYRTGVTTVGADLQ